MSTPSTSPPPGRAKLWACFFAPGAAWYLLQQGLGAVVRVACGGAGPPFGLGFGIAALLVCIACAVLAAPAARGEGDEPAVRTRRFIARVAVGVAGIFALAVVYQTAAVLLVPPCAR